MQASRFPRAGLLLAVLLVAPLVDAQDPIDIPDLEALDLGERFDDRTSDEAKYEFTDEIPAPEERADGPRIRVQQIIIDKLQDYPEIGAYIDELYDIVDARRAEFAAENRILASGYTEAELAEFADLLKSKIAANPNADLSEQDLHELNDTLRRQQWERGLTYFQIEEVANEVKKYYRERGMFLARAVIPEQEVVNGIITVKILEGRLEDVTVVNNTLYSTEKLIEPFKPLLNLPVMHHKMEQAFYLLNDYPGFSAFGFFAPGEEVGNTVLNLQVNEETRWIAALRADNHGTRFTGDRRTYASVTIHNPLGRADMLNLGALQSSAPANTKLGALRYHTPIFNPNTHLRVILNYNDFTVEDDENIAVNDLEISGINKSSEIGFSHQWMRSRVFNYTSMFNIAEKQSEIDAIIELPNSGDHSRSAEVGFRIEGISERLKALALVSVRAMHGVLVEDAPPDRQDDFTKVSIDASLLKIFRSPIYGVETRLVLNSSVVYGDTILPAYEQIAIGGAQSVRGFKVNDFSADRGGYLGAEWYWDLPEKWNKPVRDYYLNDVLQVAIFADTSYGTQVSETAGLNDRWARMSSVGLLLKFEWPKMFEAEVSFARPTGSRSNRDNFAQDEKDWRIYLDITFFMRS